MEVAYDLARSPVTFDFVNFLGNIERERISRGESDISLTFVKGEREDSLRDRAFSPERKQFRVQSLLAQLPDLLPSITRVVMGGEGVQDVTYLQPSTYEPVLKAPAGAMAAVSEYIRFGKPIVTITLRDSDFQVERNSNLAEWVKVADWLNTIGYEAIFLPDTEAVIDGRMPDCGVHPIYVPGAMSQTIRLALYEYAVLNCFTSGGPMMLAMWSSAPAYVCRLIHPGVLSCSREKMEFVGLAERDSPESFKWISWAPDDSQLVTAKLKEILPVCMKRMRPLIMPKTFSVVGEDDRKAHAVAALARGYKSFEPVLPHKGHMILCCYGPSLKHTAWEIPQLDGDVFTVSGAHDFIAGMGIKIKGHFESDPRPHKARLISRPQAGTKFYLASCCHPDVFDRLEGHDIELWHPWNSARSDAIIKEIDPNGFVVLGGSNVGLRAMVMATGLGYRKITILGMDCSFDLGGAQHAGFHSGKVQKTIKVKLPDGAWYWTSPSMIQGCSDFFSLLHNFEGVEMDIKGDGLLQHRLRLSQAQPLAA